MTAAQFNAELQALVDDGGNSFTAQDKVNFQAWASEACAIQGELRRLALRVRALEALWNGGASTARGNIPLSTVLSNPTDIQGTQSLERGDWPNLQTYMNQLISDATQDLSATANLALMVKAAGVRIQG